MQKASFTILEHHTLILSPCGERLRRLFLGIHAASVSLSRFFGLHFTSTLLLWLQMFVLCSVSQSAASSGDGAERTGTSAMSSCVKYLLEFCGIQSISHFYWQLASYRLSYARQIASARAALFN